MKPVDNEGKNIEDVTAFAISALAALVAFAEGTVLLLLTGTASDEASDWDPGSSSDSAPDSSSDEGGARRASPPSTDPDSQPASSAA